MKLKLLFAFIVILAYAAPLVTHATVYCLTNIPEDGEIDALVVEALFDEPVSRGIGGGGHIEMYTTECPSPGTGTTTVITTIFEFNPLAYVAIILMWLAFVICTAWFVKSFFK